MVGVSCFPVEDAGGNIEDVRVARINPNIASKVITSPNGGPVLPPVYSLINYSLGLVKFSTGLFLVAPCVAGNLSGGVNNVGTVRINGETAKSDTLIFDNAVIFLHPCLAGIC